MARDWDALLSDAAERGLSVGQLATELGYVNSGRVSAENIKRGGVLKKRGTCGPIFRHSHEPNFRCPDDWKLTGQEAQFFAVLVDADGEVSSAELLAKITTVKREPKIVDVLACRIRKKLAPFNINLHRRWGKGIFLDPVQRKRLRAGAVTLKPSERSP